MSVGKKFFFAALTTVIFFGLAEVVLQLAGIRPQIIERDPFVGFTSRIPLFVAGRGDGDREILRTAKNKLPWFNEQTFPRHKPANAYRIFCLGGSTTYGRPYDDTTSFCGWLRELLPAADASRGWEVINAGGISYASYRVALVLEELVAYEPDLFIVYTGHNEFLEDRTYSSLKNTSPLIENLAALLSHTRTYSAMHALLRPDQSEVPSSADNLLPGEVATKLDKGVGPDAFTRNDTQKDHILAHFQLNLRRIVDLARAAGADVLLVTPASNLRNCSPFKSETRHDLSMDQQRQFFDRIEQAKTLLSQGQADALPAIDQALQIDDRYAAAHFLRGQCLDKLQRYRDARTAFERARDEDICPLRALSQVRDIVLGVAREKQVPIVDFQALVDEKSADGIPGDDFFLDHVHPTIEGHRWLALSILDHLIELGTVHVGADWGADAMQQVTQRVLGRVDQEAQGQALLNLAKVFAWAGKREEANRMALKAADLLQSDVNATYLAANALIETGELDSAITKLKQAIAADPRYTLAYSSLGVAYQRKGMPQEAQRQYKQALELDANNASALNNLGAYYLEAGQVDLAAPLLERAVQVNPRYAKGHHNLGVLYVKQRRWSEAIESLRKAIEIDGEFAKAHADLGSVYESQTDIEQAVFHYRQALRLDDELLMTANRLAWILATSSNETIRDGGEALHWARHCAEGTAYQNPGVFNTLAAAYAASGDFASAVNWQTRALEAAPAELKATCVKRLELYKAGRTLHDR